MTTMRTEITGAFVMDVAASTRRSNDITLEICEHGEEADVLYSIPLNKANARWLISALKHAVKLNKLSNS